MTNVSGASGWRVDRTTSSAGEGYGTVESFVPANGQVLFVLALAPDLTFEPILFVNGVQYVQGIDYTIVGTDLTWLDVDFVLNDTDLLVIYYST